MGITSSLVTGLSGLSTSQSQIDVVGNNIANVNTVGFKSSRLDFKTQFLENFSYGTAPSADVGGTNPLQIGLGTQAGAITKDFGDGSLQVTGVPTNMAIQGNGFFVLKDGTRQVYTRDGSFQLNGLNQLVSGTGQLVQGYGADANYNITAGVLTNLTIPVGSLTVAQATSKTTFTGNLNTGGDLPTAVSDLTLGQPLYLTDGAGGVNPTTPPTGATLLTDITDSTGAAQFQLGDVITLKGTKGVQDTRAIAPETLTVTGTTTLADLQSFFTGTLGIDTTAGANGAIATTPGVTIPATGNTATLTIDGNPGLENDLTLDNNSFSITRAGTVLTPYTFTKNSTADGESTATSMTAYDSLGTPITVNITAVLESKSSSGSTWRYFATSPANTNLAPPSSTAVGTGTLSFDTSGHQVSSTTPIVNINRAGTGAQPNLSVNIDFSQITALSGTSSQIASTYQDGSPPGTLTSFAIGTDGIIMGSFSNGLSRTVGQVALATFRNNEGLIDDGSNTYIEGPNSGNAIISAPQQLSSGRIVAGSLELSNVDLSSEFVQLIAASTAFSASSKVITTSNQLLQDLLSSVH
ncbi:MAG TPA: flagellar hook-basal body complex protein [Phycisphaerae bacterium]|nr:flagellar hook-basal body complex protein [Phycisphaerae bacterium]